MLFLKNKYVNYSYRIEHAMEINVPKSINANDGLAIYKKIVYAINIHREAMKLV